MEEAPGKNHSSTDLPVLLRKSSPSSLASTYLSSSSPSLLMPVREDARTKPLKESVVLPPQSPSLSSSPFGTDFTMTSKKRDKEERHRLSPGHAPSSPSACLSSSSGASSASPPRSPPKLRRDFSSTTKGSGSDTFSSFSPSSPDRKKRSNASESRDYVDAAALQGQKVRKIRNEESLPSSSSSVRISPHQGGKHIHQSSHLSGVCTPQEDAGTQHMAKYSHVKSSSLSSPSKIPRVLSSTSSSPYQAHLEKSVTDNEEEEEKRHSPSTTRSAFKGRSKNPSFQHHRSPLSRHSPKDREKAASSASSSASPSSVSSSSFSSNVSVASISRREGDTQAELAQPQLRLKTKKSPITAKASPAVTAWKKMKLLGKREGGQDSSPHEKDLLLEKKESKPSLSKTNGKAFHSTSHSSVSPVPPASSCSSSSSLSRTLHFKNGDMSEKKKTLKMRVTTPFSTSPRKFREEGEKKKTREEGEDGRNLRSEHSLQQRPQTTTPATSSSSSSLCPRSATTQQLQSREKQKTSSSLPSSSSSSSKDRSALRAPPSVVKASPSSASSSCLFQSRKESSKKKHEQHDSDLPPVPKVTLSILSDLLTLSHSLSSSSSYQVKKTSSVHSQSEDKTDPEEEEEETSTNRLTKEREEDLGHESQGLPHQEQKKKKKIKKSSLSMTREGSPTEEQRTREESPGKENARSSSARKKRDTNQSGSTDLSAIMTIDLHGRKIEEVDDLSFCKQLRRLDVSRNLLSSLHFASMNLELRWLKAADNRLSSGLDLKQSLQHLANLVVLDLSDNSEITGLDDFSCLASLKTLVLSGNELKRLSFSSPVFSSLECLILSRNKIEEVEKPSKPLENLKKLSLSDNRLRTFPFSGSFPGLQELRLNGNHLVSLAPLASSSAGPGGGLLYMSNLKILDLGRNQIHKIQAVRGLKGHLKLTQLNIAGNPILTDASAMKEIEESIVSSLPSLKIFNSKPLTPRPPANPRKLAWLSARKRAGSQENGEKEREERQEKTEEGREHRGGVESSNISRSAENGGTDAEREEEEAGTTAAAKKMTEREKWEISERRRRRNAVMSEGRQEHDEEEGENKRNKRKHLQGEQEEEKESKSLRK